MANRRKNTRAYTRANPGIPMYTNLPQGGRKNLNKKRVDPNPTWKTRGSISVNSQYKPIARRESSLSSKSKNTRLLGGIFSTPLLDERTYQDKDLSLVGTRSPRLELIAKMNQRLGPKSSFGNPLNSKAVSYTQPNLINLDDPIDSKATSVDPKELQSEIGFLRKWVAKEEAKHSHLEKDKE